MTPKEYRKIFEEEYNKIMKHAPEAIDWLLENCDKTRWDIVARAVDILGSGYVNRVHDNS